MINRNKLDKAIMVLSSVFIFSITSCYQIQKIDKTINAYPINKDNYKFELLLKLHVKGQGSMNPFDNPGMEKYQFDKYIWIYCDKIQGRIDTSNFICTYHQRHYEYPYGVARSGTKGFIEFKTDSVVIIKVKFRFNINGNEKDPWLPTEFNGRYKLKVNSEPVPLIDKEFPNK
jgi:hypothetical protein